ncbi:perilipin-3-like isoform X2 [Dermochelys coriacea]|uniref:perilipin-3-like isoform X2 n=1 Tax=Dermochelys coriacea TaxID=27794 RepID=UPI0018E81EC2|nr:perilipin-3-like isoform X2 [Dermochelys coriacea]XP_038243800.1 perilipin-3-like isoform X2 [Dermochelys coriacea]XP_043373361.1 perilipin-3-like isoform X2 [Dermochelys coriacea]
MSSEKQIYDSSLEIQEQAQQNLLRRVASLPLVSSAYDMAATAYTSTKESHPYLKSLCDVAEKGVKTISEAAASRTQPILTSFEPQIATANESTIKGPDPLDEKLPSLQITVDKVASDTKELVSSKVEAASRFSSLVDVTREAVQESVESTKAVMTHSVNTVMGSRMGQMAVSGVEAVLEKSAELLDQYLPITDEELAELATSIKEDGVAPLQPQSYFVRLGSLSSKLRHRAYQHSLAKIKNTRQSIQDALSQLHQTIDLIEYVKQGVDQKLQDGQEKLHQMWLDWSKRQTGGSEDTELVQPELETRALTMFQSIIQQLQATCLTLMSSIQGFPSNIQDKVQQVCHSTKELQTSFSTVHSFQDLSSRILTQSRKQVTKAQGYMDELLEYIVHNTPLSWLVGPFMLSSKIPEEAMEPSE